MFRSIARDDRRGRGRRPARPRRSDARDPGEGPARGIVRRVVGIDHARSPHALAPGWPVKEATSRVTVWHDGSCPLCRREIALMRRLDRRGRIAFVNVASAESCPVDRAGMLARFHAQEDGRLLSGAAAFAAMWRAVPMLRPLGIAARNPLVLAGLERLYRVFLRLRPTLQAVARRIERR